MNRTRQLFILGRAIHTQVTRNAVEVGPRTARLKEIQKKLQMDDGVPVHLKGGVKDRLLFGFTCLVTALGIGMSVETLVDDGVPVHLKAGVGDKLLYQFTVFLTLIGLGMSGDVLYRIVSGKKD